MLIGRFYFRQTANGNLLGEYSHRTSKSRSVYAEAATRTAGVKGWIGEYRTVWREEPNFTPSSALLKISHAEGSASLFQVRWFDERNPGRLLFEGEAMECEGNLVGDYTMKEKES